MQNERHDVIKFELWKTAKKTLANICQIICRKFHQNRFIRLGCRDDTHTHTDRHTHTHTHTLGSIATYSVKLTEYKKQQQEKKIISLRNELKMCLQVPCEVIKHYVKFQSQSSIVI